MKTEIKQNGGSAILPGLNFNSKPPVLDSIQQAQFVEYRPINTVTPNTPMDFIINGSSDYIDMSRSMLAVKFKITNLDDTPTVVAERLSIINLGLESLFSHVEIYLNGTLVSPSVNNFPIKAMIKTMLEYSGGVKLTKLKALGYYADTPLFFEDTDPLASFNDGMKDRSALIVGSKDVTFYGPLMADVLGIKKWLVGGVDLHIRLTPSSPEFFLVKPADNAKTYKINLIDTFFHACKVTPEPGVLIQQNLALLHKPIEYHYERERTQIYNLKAGSLSMVEDNVFSFDAPSKIVVAFISALGFNGSYQKNPFNAQHANVSSIAIYKEGISLPALPMRLNFTDGKQDFMQAFYNLYTGYNTDRDKEDDNGITPVAFEGGVGFYVFDMKAGYNTNYDVLPERKNIRIESYFRTGLPEDIVCLVYGIFPDKFTVNASRLVTPTPR